MLLNRQKICKHLCRMIFIGQSVPYRYTCISGKLLNNALFKATILNAIKHTAKYARCILNTLLLTDLRALWIQIGHTHSHIMGCYLKRTSRSCTCLFEDQSNVLTNIIVNRNALFLLVLQLSRKLQKICNLLCGEIL